MASLKEANEVLVGKKVKIALDKEKKSFSEEMQEFEGKVGTITEVKHAMPFSSGIFYFEIEYPDGTKAGVVDTWGKIIKEEER